jgi:intracellular sulfur oxidation DsrE/DsrF family protein
MKKALINTSLFVVSLASFGFSGTVSADKGGVPNLGDNECPVGLVSGMELDAEFGPGTEGLTRCLDRRHNVKVVMQINRFCRDDVPNAECGDKRAYALGNIRNMIKDYEITHGMKRGKDYEIVAVVHSGGWAMLVEDGYEFTNIAGEGGPQTGLKTLSNQFQGQVEELISQGVRFLFCQNTTRSMVTGGNLPTVGESASGGGATEALIDGVEYVTAGVTAISDFQSEGYRYVQP